MEYLNTLSKNVLDIVSLGRTVNDFNPSFGDYIVVTVHHGGGTNTSSGILGQAYSNRLLMRDVITNTPYIGHYHYHPENPKMGYCAGKHHNPNNRIELKPIPLDGSMGENKIVNLQDNYRKQVNVYKDDDGRIYIKPNEIIKNLNGKQGKYSVKIRFQRDGKAELGNFLNIMRGNLIENGNFFAGLEATQAGDLDRSYGKNDIIMMNNPGFSNFVLCQNGLPGNEYKMRVTGIKPNKNYVFSCWIAWNSNYDGGNQICRFDNVSSQATPQDETVGISPTGQTDLGGSYVTDNTVDDRILAAKTINGISWIKKYIFISTNSQANLGYMHVRLGLSGGDFYPTTNPLAKRYITDLRLEEVESFTGSPITNYLNTLREDYKLVRLFKKDLYTKQNFDSNDNTNINHVYPEPISDDLYKWDTMGAAEDFSGIGNLLELDLNSFLQQTLKIGTETDSENQDVPPQITTEDDYMKKGGKIYKRRKR
tara:strand:+ start:2142 stop:3581 length:1440 start_codon:yes stop_codon:yes gene_type:complete